MTLSNNKQKKPNSIKTSVLTEEQVQFCRGLRDERLKRGLTLYHLAALTRLSVVTIQKIELTYSGPFMPNRKYANRIPEGYMPHPVTVERLRSVLKDVPVLETKEEKSA